MRKQLYFILVVSALLAFAACSNSSSNNNSQSTDTSTQSSSSENVAAAAPPPPGCPQPDLVELTNAVYNAKEDYTLSYSWTSVSNASKYSFNFYIDGSVAFSNANVTTTSITFTQNIPSGSKIKAEVTTNCSNGQNSSPKPSFEATYFNSIAEHDIIFQAKPTNSVNDICARTCDKIKFTGASILNTDGTVINLTTNSSKIYYLDFSMVKQCIDCNGSTARRKVDPTAFNGCLADPSNDYSIYDPGKFTVCP